MRVKLMAAGHCLFLIGYDHSQFGTVIRINVSDDPDHELAVMRSRSPEDLKLLFAFEFENGDIAAEVLRPILATDLLPCIKEDWFGTSLVHALFMLNYIVTRVLSRRYGADDISDARQRCGLLRSFEIADRATEAQQTEWNEVWEALGPDAERLTLN